MTTGVRLSPPPALFTGTALTLCGLGLATSLIGVRASIEAFDTTTLGAIVGSYYLGFFLGAIVITRNVEEVGHIRVFAALASVASGAVVLHSVFVGPIAWMIIRFATGASAAGLFVVVESWLNEHALDETRGRLLALYSGVMMVSQGVSQFLLNLADPEDFELFVIASVLVSASVVPIALASQAAPVIVEATGVGLERVRRAAPLGVSGVFMSGVLQAVILGLGPAFAHDAGFSVAEISLFMALPIIGGFLSQWPLGWWSDRVDRRKVIILCALGGAGAALLGTGADALSALLPVIALVGALSFPLYPLSLAHLNDHLKPEELTRAASVVLALYGAGAVSGPLCAGIAIQVAGPKGFFWTLLLVQATLAAVGVVRLGIRRPLPAPDQTTYVPMPAASTAIVAALNPEAAVDPRSDEGLVADAGTSLWYRSLGEGPPIVLVHDLGSSSRSWGAIPRSLVHHGHRVVTFDLRGHGQSGPADSYGLGGHVADLAAICARLELEDLQLVGLGVGAHIAAEYAVTTPEAVQGLHLVNPLWWGGEVAIEVPYSLRLTVLLAVAYETNWSRFLMAQAFARSLYPPRGHEEAFQVAYEDARLVAPAALAPISDLGVRPDAALVESLSGIPTLRVMSASDAFVSADPPPVLDSITTSVVDGGHLLGLDNAVELDVLLLR